MVDFIRIDLDRVKKARNSQEWRMVNRARCGDVVSVGDGWNIVKVAKMLIAGGADPSMEVRVFDDGVLWFSGANLRTWADNRFGRAKQPEHLRRGSNG